MGCYDATCPDCGAHIGWMGELTDKPPCPQCGKTWDQEKLKKLEAKIDAEIEKGKATCPRRMLEVGPWKREEGLDGFKCREDGYDHCLFCGSIGFFEFYHLCKEAAESSERVVIEPADKGYKFYINVDGKRLKFYTQHAPKGGVYFERWNKALVKARERFEEWLAARMKAKENKVKQENEAAEAETARRNDA